MPSTTLLPFVKNVYVQSKLLGLFPLYEQDGAYFISYTLLFHSIFIGIYLLAISVYFTIFNLHTAEKFYLNYEINYVEIIIMIVIVLISFYELRKHLDEFNDDLDTLQIIENDLLKMGVKLDYRLSRFTWFNFLFECFAAGLRILKNILLEEPLTETLIGVGSYAVLLAFITTFVQRYSDLISIPSTLFFGCHKELVSLSCSNLKDTTSRLEKLSYAHHILCGVSTSLNEIQSIQILLIITISFILCVSEVYLLCLALKSDLKHAVLFIFIKIFWLFIGYNLCWQVIYAAENCNRQAKEFNILLYQLMVDDTTNEISNNKKLRLHVSMKREVVFTACGFFSLDFTLIHSMIAAATTYLVILIQFGQPASSSVTPIISTNENITNTH